MGAVDSQAQTKLLLECSLRKFPWTCTENICPRDDKYLSCRWKAMRYDSMHYKSTYEVWW
jgi:hypothetical protein